MARTAEQLDTWIRPVWAELIDGAHHCHDQLTEIIARVGPDVIIEDNVARSSTSRSARWARPTWT